MTPSRGRKGELGQLDSSNRRWERGGRSKVMVNKGHQRRWQKKPQIGLSIHCEWKISSSVKTHCQTVKLNKDPALCIEVLVRNIPWGISFPFSSDCPIIALCHSSSYWLFGTMMTSWQNSKMLHRFPLPEKSHSSLSLNHIWTSVANSVRACVPTTPVWARSVWGPGSLGCTEHRVSSSDPSSFLSPVFPHFLHPDSNLGLHKASLLAEAWRVPKGHEGGYARICCHRNFVQLGSAWDSGDQLVQRFPGGGVWVCLGVVLSFTPTSSDMKKHFLRGIKKCLPLTLPRSRHPLCGLWACGRPRGPPPPTCCSPLQEVKEAASVLYCIIGVQGELEQGGSTPSFPLRCF